MANRDHFDITIDARMIEHAGIGRYIKTLLPILDKRYKLALLGDPKLLGSIGLSAKIIECQFDIYGLEEMLFLSKKIPSTRVFWTPHFNTPLWIPKRVKSICTIHDTYHLRYPDTNPIKRWMARYRYKTAAEKSDAILTVSNFSKSEIAQCLNKNVTEKTQVIPNCIAPIHLSHKTSTGQKDPYLLYVGSQRENKNLRQLLRCFHQLKKPLRLILAGQTNKSLLHFAKNMSIKNVEFTGHVSEEELAELYQNCMAVCLPSTYEGFGYTGQEAMAYGKPLVCSDIPVFREHLSQNALFFDLESDDDLIGKLLEVIEKSQEEPILFDHQTLFNKFEASYINFLNQILSV